ncbi:MAG: adenylate/guanylate cyclase domain-containing protein [Desulfobacteraceae bacterium]
MKTGNPLKINTLQGRLLLFLILPVFCIIFLWGLVTFFYTRDAMLRQWNEAAVLKMQRAAHFIEMRMFRPVELIEVMFKTIPGGQSPLFNELVTSALEDVAGVVAVSFESSCPGSAMTSKRHDMGMDRSGMGNSGMAMGREKMGSYRHSRIMDISRPVYDTRAGEKTFTLKLALLDENSETMGVIGITMEFSFLLGGLSSEGADWLESGKACIVDADHRYVFHTDDTMEGRQVLGDSGDDLELSVLENMKDHAHATITGKGHPPETIAGFYKLSRVPWTMILYGRGEEILKPIIRYRNAFAASGVCLIGIILFLIRTHVVKLADKIRTLSLRAAEVARGEYGETIPITSRDEMGVLMESFNEMVAGLKERDMIRNSFGRYVDPEFARMLMRRPDAGKLGGQRKEVVMLMSDIRGFTPLADKMSPEITIEMLNRYFSYMIAIIQEQKGIIVDFFGDAILVFFEPHAHYPEEEDIGQTIGRAMACAEKMQQAMKSFNGRDKNDGVPPMEMGIGMHTGQVIVGNIGSESRKKYGIVGAAVNLTSRIQATAKGGEIVVSRPIFDTISETVTVIRSFTAELKGVERPVFLYAIAAEEEEEEEK